MRVKTNVFKLMELRTGRGVSKETSNPSDRRRVDSSLPLGTGSIRRPAAPAFDRAEGDPHIGRARSGGEFGAADQKLRVGLVSEK
jgi:hypothetical protein